MVSMEPWRRLYTSELFIRDLDNNEIPSSVGLGFIDQSEGIIRLSIGELTTPGCVVELGQMIKL